MPALQTQCDDLKAKVEKEKAECRKLQLNIDSMNIVVREPPAVGKSKVVCGHCHHKGHRNQSTNPCTLTKCTDYTYCGVKDKHHEYFQKLNAMKLELSKRKAAINDLENQISSMENFKTKSEYNFIKNLSPRLFAINSSYKTNKAKLMRDIKLLRTALDGRIPEVTANDQEQLQILLKKCKTDLKSEVDARFSSDENMNTDYLNAVTSEIENSKEKTEYPLQLEYANATILTTRVPSIQLSIFQ